MKTTRSLILAATALGLSIASNDGANWKEGFKNGAPGIKSITQLAFGPDGILFAADSKAAAIVAIDTGDNKAGAASPVKIENINQKLAALLGTQADQVQITDLAVNPVSHKAYLAANRGRGPEAVPVIVRVDAGGELEVLNLDKIAHSRAELPAAPIDQLVGQGNRQSNPRMESITDIAFLGDRVLVAGLSNEEFASSLRSIPFPFDKSIEPTSVEIYHGAHGKFETRAPIRTFVPLKVGDETQLLAAYQCTPLVQIPLNAIEPKAKVKGKTVAELGNRNRPLDMIAYRKDGKDYLLIANNARGMMKVPADKLQEAESITDPVKSETKGLAYETLKDVTGVEQLAQLDDKNAVVVRKTDAGQSLEALPLP